MRLKIIALEEAIELFITNTVTQADLKHNYE